MDGSPISIYIDRPGICFDAHILRNCLMKDIAEFIGLYKQTVIRYLLKYNRMLECNRVKIKLTPDTISNTVNRAHLFYFVE